ncbi:MAG TPA: hypothetical protein VKZ53_15935 [Candidatus Angelobacter sp.]|nr:hypothetical protein [Candidatus Angelobacter sp.]
MTMLLNLCNFLASSPHHILGSMIRSCLVDPLTLFICLLLSLSTAFAQETQSLGDLARKIRAQKNHGQDPQPPAASPSATPSVDAAASVTPAVTQSLPEENVTITADLNADFAKDPYAGFRWQAAIAGAVGNDRFEWIDKLADDVRTTKARYSGGGWKLRGVYGALETPITSDYASKDPWSLLFARLERWKAQRPDSITARVALAGAWINYGWAARGGGTIDTVTEDNWQLFQSRAHKARAILEEAQKLTAKCPEWFVVMQQVAVSEQWDPTEFNALTEKAIAFEPDYYYYYQGMAGTLLPKWGGEEGDATRYAEATANHIGGKKGDMIYYEIGKDLICACDNEQGLNGMSWPRLLRGYQTLEELYGTTPAQRNMVAYMALTARDTKTAQKMFDQIGENWDEKTWRSYENFESARKNLKIVPKQQ